MKRTSGKVFGPFDKRLIEQMVRSNKLTGHEDVSIDKVSWVSLRTVAGFEGEDEVDADVAGMTQIPGRPGPAVGVDDLDDFNDELGGRGEDSDNEELSRLVEALKCQSKSDPSRLHLSYGLVP